MGYKPFKSSKASVSRFRTVSAICISHSKTYQIHPQRTARCLVSSLFLLLPATVGARPGVQIFVSDRPGEKGKDIMTYPPWN